MDAVFNDTVNIVEIDEGFDHYTLVLCVYTLDIICIWLTL